MKNPPRMSKTDLLEQFRLISADIGRRVITVYKTGGEIIYGNFVAVDDNRLILEEDGENARFPVLIGSITGISYRNATRAGTLQIA